MRSIDWVIEDIRAERARQDAKWGEPQRQPDGTGSTVWPAMGSIATQRYGGLEEEAKFITDYHAQNSEVTFADILLEEVFEALASDSPKDLREELIQVAAVAVKWVEVLDRENPR